MPPRDAQRTRPTDSVLEQFEHHRVMNAQIVERGAFLHIRAVEEYLALVGEPNVAVPLPDEQPGDAADDRRAATIVRPG